MRSDTNLLSSCLPVSLCGLLREVLGCPLPARGILPRLPFLAGTQLYELKGEGGAVDVDVKK